MRTLWVQISCTSGIWGYRVRIDDPEALSKDEIALTAKQQALEFLKAHNLMCLYDTVRSNRYMLQPCEALMQEVTVKEDDLTEEEHQRRYEALNTVYLCNAGCSSVEC